MSVAETEALLATLNPAQREAVVHVEGPLLVIAGAGSGKTRVLTNRVAHLIDAVGAKPNEILAITFTNKAAGEMRERLERMLGRTARAIWILTFHAACGRILRREAERLGYRSNFTIYDQADQVRLVKQCLEELEKDPKRFTPRGIHHQISNEKNLLVGARASTAQRVGSFYDQTVAEVYSEYQRRLFASNAVDFDDMLMLTVEVLERFPEARERWQKAFRYILVDEYQDTNHAQYRLLQLLAAEHRNVFAVGDPDQSIYAFRGADIRNILEFERDFPGTQTIALEQNYRSTNAILARGERGDRAQHASGSRSTSSPSSARASRSRRSRSRTSTPRRASSPRGSPRSSRRATRAAEIAVFYRTNAQSRVLEDVLVRQGIPYQVIGGPRFYERAEIKDAGRVPAGDRQSGRRRVADADREPAAARDRRHVALAARRSSPTRRGSRSARRSAAPRRPALGAAPLQARAAAHALLESLDARRRRSSACRELVERVIERTRLPRRRSRPSGRSRRTAGSRTCRSSSASRGSTYEGDGEPTLSGFLQEISLYSDQDTIRGEQSLVTLMTLHNAKGLEFRAVFVIGMEEGIFPHARSIEEQGIEEERRLATWA